MLLAATLALLVALFVLWVAISLGANLIGGWMLLPVALGIALLMRRRQRDAR